MVEVEIKEQIQYIQKSTKISKEHTKKQYIYKINHKDEQRVNKVKKTNKSMHWTIVKQKHKCKQ